MQPRVQPSPSIFPRRPSQQPAQPSPSPPCTPHRLVIEAPGPLFNAFQELKQTLPNARVVVGPVVPTVFRALQREKRGEETMGGGRKRDFTTPCPCWLSGSCNCHSAHTVVSCHVMSLITIITTIIITIRSMHACITHAYAGT